MEKSELDPKQVFDFLGYQFNLKEGKFKPTLDRWQTLTTKIKELLTGPTCPVLQLMSLIGLLTATEKQVHPDRLHMNPVAPQTKLEGPSIPIKGDTSSQVAPPPSKMVAGGK